MTYSQYPYPSGGTAGNEVAEGKVVMILESLITHPSHSDNLVDKGDPVKVGSLVGIALQSATANTEYISIQLDGIFDLSVDPASGTDVAIGEPVYINDSTCIIQNNTTGGTALGVALNVCATNTTTVIPVRLNG